MKKAFHLEFLDSRNACFLITINKSYDNHCYSKIKKISENISSKRRNKISRKRVLLMNQLTESRRRGGRKTVVPEFWRRRSINYRIVRAGGSTLKEGGQFGGGEGTNRVRRGGGGGGFASHAAITHTGGTMVRESFKL